jgi:hypothetical protein
VMTVGPIRGVGRTRVRRCCRTSWGRACG